MTKAGAVKRYHEVSERKRAYFQDLNLTVAQIESVAAAEVGTEYGLSPDTVLKGVFQAELLAEMLAWLPERYPVWATPLAPARCGSSKLAPVVFWQERFRVERSADGAAQVVHTLTPGYVHAFAVAEYAD